LNASGNAFLCSQKPFEVLPTAAPGHYICNQAV
jgi:hypothetical protein